MIHTIITRYRNKSSLYLASAIFFIVIGGCCGTFIRSLEASWAPPASPPMLTPNLKSIIDLDDLVDRIATPAQTLLGPLAIGTGAGSSRTTKINYLAAGNTIYAASGGSPTWVDAPVSNSMIGVYGQATTGGTSGVGIYAKTMGDGSNAIIARSASATGYAGVFYGRAVVMAGTDTATSSQLFAEESATSHAGVAITQPSGFFQASPVAATVLTAVSSGGSSPYSNVGVYGKSSVQGIAIAATDEAEAGLGSTLYNNGIYGYSDTVVGVRGEAQDGASGPIQYQRGIYGSSQKGIGVQGKSQAVAENGTASGVGIYACGTNTSLNIYDGDLKFDWMLAIGRRSDGVVVGGADKAKLYAADAAGTAYLTKNDIAAIVLLCSQSDCFAN